MNAEKSGREGANRSTTSTPKAFATFSKVDKVGFPFMELERLTRLTPMRSATSCRVTPFALQISFIRKSMRSVLCYAAKIRNVGYMLTKICSLQYRMLKIFAQMVFGVIIYITFAERRKY